MLSRSLAGTGHMQGAQVRNLLLRRLSCVPEISNEFIVLLHAIKYNRFNWAVNTYNHEWRAFAGLQALMAI